MLLVFPEDGVNHLSHSLRVNQGRGRLRIYLVSREREILIRFSSKLSRDAVRRNFLTLAHLQDMACLENVLEGVWHSC